MTEKQQYMDKVRTALYKADAIAEATVQVMDNQRKKHDDVDGGTLVMVIHEYIGQALEFLDQMELCKDKK